MKRVTLHTPRVVRLSHATAALAMAAELEDQTEEVDAMATTEGTAKGLSGLEPLEMSSALGPFEMLETIEAIEESLEQLQGGARDDRVAREFPATRA